MTKKEILKELKPYLTITVGMLIFSFAAVGFLVPHKIVGGGATGISTVLYYLFNIPVGVGYFLVNVILLVIAVKVLGPKFGIKTVFAIIVGSIFLGILQPIMPVDGILPDEKFMSTIIAAILVGIGIGIALSEGGSTGGTDVVAMLVSKYYNVTPGKILMLCDFCVIAMTLLIYDEVDREAVGAMIYGYVMMAGVSFTVDYVLTGKTQSAQLLICTDKCEEVAKELSDRIDRGVTVIDARGWYTGQSKAVLLVVVRKYEASDVLRIAKQVDPGVFMTMAPVMGVYGKRFDEVKGLKAPEEQK